jgi:hypothetical protein
MPNIDIPVPLDARKLFDLPPCSAIKLPSPKPLKVQLPTGGSLQAFADISKGIPTDCAMTFSLLVQIAPFLAGTECLFKLLALIGPLIDVIKGLAAVDMIKVGKALPKFLKAAEKLAPCLLVVTGAPLIPFLKDLLCLIIKVLNCFLGQLKSLLAIMGGITLQLQTAKADGNTELLDTLNCAKENADLQAQHLTAAIEPIGVILDLALPLMELAGIPPIKLPGVGSGTDVESLTQLVKTLQTVVATLQVAADALGGCDS